MKTIAWQTAPLGDFLKQRKDSIVIAEATRYRRVTVRLHGRGVEPRDEVDGATIKTKKQFPVKEQDLLVAEIDAKVGGYGIVPPVLAGAIVSSHYFLYEVDQSRLDVDFLGHWLKTPSPLDQIQQFIRGALNYAAIRPHHFPQLRLPVPPLPEQKRIASTLARLLQRTSEGRRLAAEIQEDNEQFLRSRAKEIAEGSPRQPMDRVAPLVRRAVEVIAGASYAELGIRSFGKGTFHKPALTAEEVGSKRLFRIQPGDLLFSNVFSWEGAIAVAQPEDKGRFGSHRFITCVPDPTKATAEFLCHWFLTDEGMAHIRAASPGAAGRNRTLGIKKLMAIPVPLPPLTKQQEFSALRRQILAARALHKDLPAELDALQAALLDQAFRGQL
jgi:type I restriction enzyme S subunit